MLIKLFLIYYLFVSSLAWLPPERCAQNKGNKRRRRLTDDGNTVKAVPVVPNITEIAKHQHDDLVRNYEKFQFLGVPIGLTDDSSWPSAIIIHAPYDCSFHTYEPRLISSIACGAGVACELSQTVSTVESYTASEGYNWGVKISSKFSISKTFEVGGEVSTGGTYSCTYTRGRTTTTAAKCSTAAGQGGHLNLYNVQTDMICNFGDVVYTSDNRNEDGASEFNVDKDYTYLTEAEYSEIDRCRLVTMQYIGNVFLLDTNKISDTLLQKIKTKAPLYNPYTDLLVVQRGVPVLLRLFYYKRSDTTPHYSVRRIIPFTKENGDSVYEYACYFEKF